MNNLSIKAFTLVEILVVISIIMIITIWASRINFNKSSDSQKANIFENEVFSFIETQRNNSLLWKWIWSSLENPTKINIDIETSQTWSIKLNYFSWSTIIWTWSFNKIDSFSYISDITCYNIDRTMSWSSNSISIDYINWDTFISWCNAWTSTWTIYDISTKYKSFENIIRINMLSGVMERL